MKTVEAITAEIKEKAARVDELNRRRETAIDEEETAREAMGKAVASGDKTGEAKTRTRLREIAEEISACDAGLAQLKSGESALLESLKATEVAEARARIDANLKIWGEQLDAMQADFTQFYREHLATRTEAIYELQKSIQADEWVLRNAGKLAGYSSAIERPGKYSQTGGRALPLLEQVKAMATGTRADAIAPASSRSDFATPEDARLNQYFQ